MKVQAARSWYKLLFGALVLLLAQLILVPQVQAQHTSVECPAQTASVSAGGTVTINISDCEFVYQAGGDGDIDGGSFGAADLEDHGTATTRHAGGSWFLDYSHNGTSGIGSTDVFELSDGSAAGSGDVRFTITINASASPLTVSPGTLPTLTAGTSFTQALSTTGGTAPYTYSLQSGVLPPGLSLSSGGVLSGTPTQRGAYSFSVRATDSATPTANFVDKGYTGSVQNPSLSLSTNAATAIQSTPFSLTLSTNGGVAPYAYQLETGSFPAGISISTDGVISGTTTAAPGNYPVTIRVTDSSTGPGTYFEVENFTLTVSALPSVSIAVSPASVAEDGPTNLTYTVTRSVTTASALTVNLTSGGTATSGSDYSGGVSSVTIPANSASATVIINPASDLLLESNETVILTVATGSGYTVGAPSSATGTITNDETSSGGASTFCSVLDATVANGGSIAINVSTCDGPFDAGMSAGGVLNPVNGTYTIGPNSGGTQFVTYVHNGNSATSDRFELIDENLDIVTVNITILAPTSPLVVSPASLPAMVAGTPFSQTLTTNGGTAPYTYALDSGALPVGLSLSSGGLLSGTPTQRGNFAFNVRVTDATNPTALSVLKGYNGSVANPTLTLATNSGTAVSGSPFSQTLSTSGGVAPYSYQLETGSFPAGISISSAGVVSGTTTAAAGNYPVVLRVGDASTPSAAPYFELENYTLTVSPPPSVSIAVTPATLNEDGATNATFTVTRSLNLSSPTTVNISTFGTATSGSDYSGGVASVTIPAGATTATIVIDPTVDATVEPDETVTLSIAAGTGYTVGSPSNATATILNDDVPSASIAVSPASTAENGAGNLVYTVTLNAAPNNPTSVTYTVTGTATSGTDYAAVASPLLFLTGETSKTITIDPTADSTIETDETVIITLNPGTGYSVGAPNAATGTIANDDFPALSINDVTLVEGNSGTTNAVFTVSLSASSPQTVTVNYATANGAATQPADYSNTSGSLSFAPSTTTQTITVPVIGETVPEANETFFINLSGAVNATITDGQGLGTITNDDVPVTVSPASLPNGTVATAYSQTITASGGTAPYGFAITAGSLPTGLTLAPSGTLAGTPTAGGTFNFTVTATDSAGAPGPFSGSQAYTVTIAAPTIALPATTLANGTLGQAYSTGITAATGGTAPYAYAVTAGALPGGLTLNPASGAISGTPGALGSFTFSITATDGSTGTGPYSATQSYAIEVVDIPPVASPVSMTVPYNAGATNVPVSSSGGPATSYGEVTSPAHGTVITLGTLITYQPDPGYAGPDSFTYNANNSGGTSAPATVTITVQDPVVTITPSGGLNATVAAPYTQTFTFNGGAQPWSGYQVTNLPVGLSISGRTANSVTISGTPTQAGSFNLNVSAIDSSTGNGPFTIGQAFVLTVGAPTLTMTPAAGVLNAPYATPFSQTFTASGGTGSYTYALSGTLPAGMTFSGATLSGSPTAPGSYPVTVTATDTGATGTGAPFSVAVNYTIDVPAPSIGVAPAALPAATAGAAYSQALSGTGGVGPYTLTLTSGVLPAGITLSGGALSGIPTEVGSFPITITSTDSNGQSGSRAYTLAVGAPTLVLAPGSGTTNVAFSAPVTQTFAASGGVGPYTYAISAGTLPSGVTLNASTGQLSGSTVQVGTFNYSVTATDTGITGIGAPFSVSGNFALTVAPPVITIDQASLPGGTVASAYSSTLTASGGLSPHSFAVTAGALPAGLSLSTTGVLSGTPTAGGSFTFTISASDASGAPGPFNGSRAFTLNIAAPTITLPPISLGGGQRGVAYAANLTPATGGTAPYSYAVTGGALPAGVTLSASGGLSGTPAVFGSFAFTVTATDSSTGTGPYSAQQSYSLSIIDQPPVAAASALSVAYDAPATNVPLTLSGGAPTLVAIASAPANGTATVSGTNISYQPNAGFSGTDSFTYTATNSGGTSAPATVTVTVGAPTLAISAGGPLSGTVGQAYSQTFTFTGGAAPFGTYSVTGLPTGLAISGTSSNSLTISGTPSAAGSFALTVSGRDSSTGAGPFMATQAFTLTIASPVLVMAPASGSFTATYAAPFNQTVAASGGIGPYSYALTGSLPAGVTLNTSTGTLSGTPTASGSFAFSVTATDTGATGVGAPFTVAGSYTLTIAAPTITVTPAALSGATAGAAYSATLTASGAVGPYSFSLSGGALPAGVSLSSAGQLSGTPTASGSFAFTVGVRDANGQTGSAPLTLNVSVPTLTLTPTTLPAAFQGLAYNQTLTVSGGVAPYSFAVSSGTLPTGLTLNTTTGVISGTPSGFGTATFAITVTDSTGGTRASLTVNYTLQVTARPDPANDPEVRGLVRAQVDATRRFADAQVDNFMARMESMHGEGGEGSGNGDGPGVSFRNAVRITTSDYCRDAMMMLTNPSCANRKNMAGLVSLNNWTAEGEASANTAGPVANAGSGGGAGAPWTIWAGGAIRFGDRDSNSGRIRQEFESEGITIGADYRFGPAFAAGLGIGLGRDTVDVGDNGSQSRGEAKTIALYASLLPARGWFIDGLLGYQTLDFDLKRYVTSTGALVSSNRDGDQWFATLSAGTDIESGNWQFTPYARFDMTRATLKGYAENSGSVFDLTFLDQDVNFTSLGLGTRIKYSHKTGWGYLLPQLRAEYQWNVERSADARVTYNDLVANPFSTIPLSGIGREELTFGAKFEALIGSDLALALEYLGRFSQGNGSDGTVQVGVKYAF